jgi:hypothetical protein
LPRFRNAILELCVTSHPCFEFELPYESYMHQNRKANLPQAIFLVKNVELNFLGILYTSVFFFWHRCSFSDDDIQTFSLYLPSIFSYSSMRVRNMFKIFTRFS